MFVSWLALGVAFAEPRTEVLGPDGVRLRRIGGTIDVEVTISAVPPPPEPLPGYLTPVGKHYQVRASDVVWTQPTDPFILWLPIPAGVDPERLVVAVLVPPDGFLDARPAGNVWLPSDGYPDPKHGLCGGTVMFLAQEGRTYVLAEEKRIP
jgi:hypothetical protein